MALVLFVAVTISSCHVYYHGTTEWVFGDYLWTIPASSVIVSLFFFVRTWQAWHSGSWHQDQSRASKTFGEWIDDNGNVRAFTWHLFAAIVLLLFAVGFIIYQIGQR